MFCSVSDLHTICFSLAKTLPDGIVQKLMARNPDQKLLVLRHFKIGNRDNEAQFNNSTIQHAEIIGDLSQKIIAFTQRVPVQT